MGKKLKINNIYSNISNLADLRDRFHKTTAKVDFLFLKD